MLPLGQFKALSVISVVKWKIESIATRLNTLRLILESLSLTILLLGIESRAGFGGPVLISLYI
jgi:hypothetical protein